MKNIKKILKGYLIAAGVGLHVFVLWMAAGWPFYRASDETTRDVLSWLERHERSASPFFLFVHYMDPHGPYDPSYDEEIQMIDGEIGRIVDKMKNLSLYEDSLIIFTSDHGESFGEHDSPSGHGWFLYLEQIHVPLIIKFPRNAFLGAVDQVVRNIDIMPTLLDWISNPSPGSEFDGVSLLPALRERKDLGLVSYHIAYTSRVCPEGTESVVFMENGSLFQYITTVYTERIREFYDVTRDPDQKNNIYQDSRFKPFVKRAKKDLMEIRMNMMVQEAPASKTKSTRRQLEILKSLGYIAGGAPGPGVMPPLILMEKHLEKVGLIRFADFFRFPRFGIDLNDGLGPLKIAPAGRNDHFLITDRKRRLMFYSQGKGFRRVGLRNVEDIAFDRKKEILFLVHEGKIKLVSLRGGLRIWEEPELSVWNPSRGVFVDGKSNRYILKADTIVRLDGKNRKTGEYAAAPENSGLMTIAEDGRLYVVSDDRILVFNRKAELKKVIDSGFPESISAIAADRKNRIWVLCRHSPMVRILDPSGRETSSFIYNAYGLHYDRPDPCLHLAVADDRLYIIDSWEGVLVYAVSSLGRRGKFLRFLKY